MKRVIALFIAAIMMFSLYGCAANKDNSSASIPAPDAVNTTPEPAPETTPVTATEPVYDYSGQRELIESLRSVWQREDVYSQWSYCITDLNHNGLLEVITASMQGTGLYTYADFYEVNESKNGIYKYFYDNADSGPDIIVSSAKCYYDSSLGKYYYIFDDVLRMGATGYCLSTCAISLWEGQVEQIFLGSKLEEYINSESKISYMDRNSNPTDEDNFLNCDKLYFNGIECREINLEWVEVPAEEAQTEVILPATPEVQNAGPIVITKNPRGECLAVGGKTWFIAHADNVDGLTWQLVDPNQVPYSLEEAMQLLPGLKLEALEGDTIAVSNVPANLNGWGVQALFTNGGYSAVTEPALIYVGDFIGAYASVFDAYRNAASGNYDPNASIDVFTDMGYDNLGYKFKDLDGDGTPEMIVAKMNNYNSSDMWDKVIFGVFTLKNGYPEKVFTSTARSRYLYSSYGFFYYGSGGAAYAYSALYSFKNGALNPVEAVYSEDGPKYYRVSGGDWNSSAGSEINENEFNERINAYESTEISIGILSKLN